MNCKYWQDDRQHREMADMMHTKLVDILCVQGTRWKVSKAGSIGAGFKLCYHGVDRKKNAVGMILREEYSKNAKNEKYKGLQLNEGEAGN